MPKAVFGRDFEFLPPSELLSFEEITRVARIFVSLGARKIRVTGGEPLVRREIEHLVEMLAGIDGLEDLTLTTNGSLLAEKAELLRRAGLQRVSVSLDSIDDAVFRSMNDVGFGVVRVIEGIDAAVAAGFDPVKVNCVVKRGINETGIVDLIRRFRGSGVIVRFIEYMDVGQTNGWRLDDVVPAREILAAIDKEIPLVPVEANYRGEVARRYRFASGEGEIGIVSSVTQPFCGDCTRARLSSEGKVYTCLFASEGHDLRALVRGGATDSELREFISALWGAREDRYSEIRTSRTTALPKVEMSHIGG